MIRVFDMAHISIRVDVEEIGLDILIERMISLQINVLGVCGLDMRSIYVLLRWKG